MADVRLAVTLDDRLDHPCTVSLGGEERVRAHREARVGDSGRRQAPTNERAERSEVMDAPIADRGFDLVVSTSALHYWPDPAACMAEIVRVLRPGGRVAITDWCDDYLACRVADLLLRILEPAHHRTYGTDDLERMLRDAGLGAIQVERYKIDWLWGLMTATASMSSGPVLSDPVRPPTAPGATP